ncbi:MAG: DUF1080 domain-containing protein [Pirellulales bacterium]
MRRSLFAVFAFLFTSTIVAAGDLESKTSSGTHTYAGETTIIATALLVEPAPDADGWYSLFDGKTLDGWKINEDQKAAKVENGELIIGGAPRTHVFYDGPVKNHDFKDFEFKAKVKVIGNSNSGIYFHTEYQKDGWPAKGFEAQVCSKNYGDPRKTGSLYAVKDVEEAPVPDDEWFDYHIIVKGDHVTIKINDKETIDWTQEAGKAPNKDMPGRVIGHGTFALQGHDPKSVVHYKDLKVKPL